MASMVVTPAKLVLKPGERECGILVPEPGHVRGVDFHLARRLVTGSGGEPEFDEDLVIYLEIDPARPARRRHFLVLELTEARTMPDDVESVFVGKASSASGRIMFVYELLKLEPKSKLARASS